MLKPKVPCQHCDKRTAECKISCGDWKAYEIETKEYKDLIARNKAQERVVSEYVYGLRKGSGEGGRGSNIQKITRRDT